MPGPTMVKPRLRPRVDPDVGVRLLHLFEELNKIGTTVLIATHNESLAARFDHPVMLLDGGTLTAAPRRHLKAS